MFKITTKPRIVRRVPLTIEVDGDRQDHNFVATFELLPLSETTETKLADDAGQYAFLRAAVVDLGDLVDSDEKPVPFSPELLAQLIERPEVRVALVKQYFEAVKDASAGN